MPTPFSVALTDVFAKADAKGRMTIGGVMSSAREDLESEKVLQKGLELGYFAKHGALRWMHTPKSPKDDDPEIAKVGKPLTVEQDVSITGKDGKLRKGTKFTAVLFKGNPTAEKIFRNAQAMAAEGDAYGVSLEGNIETRDGPNNRTIAKAVVRSLAIAPHPVNPDAFMEPLDLAKALTTAQIALDQSIAESEPTDEPDDPPSNASSTASKSRPNPTATPAEPDELGKACNTESVQPLSRESLDGGKPSYTPTKSGQKSKKDKEKAMDDLATTLAGLSDDDLQKVLEPYRDKLAPADDTENKRLNKALSDATECLDDLSTVLGVDRDSIPTDTETLNESVASLTKAVAEIHLLPSQGNALVAFGNLAKAISEEMVAFRAEFNSKLEVLDPLAKALGRPAAPRGVVDGALPVPHPADGAQGATGGEEMSKAQVVQSLTVLMDEAERTGNTAKFHGLGRAICELEADSRLQQINKAALNEQLKQRFQEEV